VARVSGTHRDFRAFAHRPGDAELILHKRSSAELKAVGAAHNDQRCTRTPCKRRPQASLPGGDRAGVVRRSARMSAFGYQAVQLDGAPCRGVVEAEDRKTALQALAGVAFTSKLETVAAAIGRPTVSPRAGTASEEPGEGRAPRRPPTGAGHREPVGTRPSGSGRVSARRSPRSPAN